MKKIFYILFVIAIIAVVSSCSDDESENGQSTIPDCNVNLTLSSYDLQVTLGSKLYPSSEKKNVGYGGVLVINGIRDSENNKQYSLKKYRVIPEKSRYRVKNPNYKKQ